MKNELETYVTYYDNGQKKSEMNYKDGKSDGLLTVWTENGQKMVEVNFKNGKKVVKQVTH